MSLASPENDLERSVAAQVDSIYESGWNEAIDAALDLVKARAAKWNESARAEAHGDCAESLADECDDIAQAILSLKETR